MIPLAQHLDDYLRLRRLLGHQLAVAARLLPRFVSYLDARGIEVVTVKAAVDWSLEPEAPPGSTVWAHRFTAARGFARYLSGIDHGRGSRRRGLCRSSDSGARRSSIQSRTCSR